MRKFGIKRSFNCEDLSSIVGLDLHGRVGEDSVAASPPPRRTKRLRALSTDSSCSAVCYCCDEEARAAKFMPSAPSNDALTTPKAPASSAARLISPATSYAAVAPTTPELAPMSSDDLGSLPRFPPLTRPRSESGDGPATAALESFMLKQRSSPAPSLDQDFSPSFEDPAGDQGVDSSWPKFDLGDSPSPRHVDHFPWARRVSVASSSRKSSAVSVQESSSGHAQKIPSPPHTARFSFRPMATICKLSKPLSDRHTPTVNQITEALSRIET